MVRILPLVAERSTTDVISRIRARGEMSAGILFGLVGRPAMTQGVEP